MNTEMQPGWTEAARGLSSLQVGSRWGCPGFSWFSLSGHIQDTMEVAFIADREGQVSQ